MGEHVKEAPQKKNTKLIVGIIAAIVVIAIAIGAFFVFSNSQNTPVEAGSDPFANAVVEAEYAPDQGIDWTAWTERNPSVYSWIRINDTLIDYPVLQHPVYDDYYLGIDVDGQRGTTGALYTQGTYNGSKDYTADPITVIYGHTFTNKDDMFTTLHNFEDQTFFDEHPMFEVYTPEATLTYEVVSAYEGSDDHLLYNKDLSSTAVVAEMFDTFQNPLSTNMKVRTLDEALDPETDKVLVLSTCTEPAVDTARYLLVAVLRDVQEVDPALSNAEAA